MTDKEKLEKLKKLADAMYYAANYLTTDASRLHKAMDKYHKFIIHEYKEEPKDKCKGCNNVKGCITCVDGSEYAHIEECNITGIKAKEATGKLKELIDNISEEGLKEARRQLEELTKGCMYSKDNYTDEDRKVLCEGCEEECKFKPTTSVWHDAKDTPVASKTKIVLYTNGKWDMFKAYETKDDHDNYWAGVNQALEEKGVLVKRWVYVEDLLKL